MFRTILKLKALAALALTLLTGSAMAQTVTPARVIFSKQTGQIVVADIPSDSKPAPTPNHTTPSEGRHALVIGKWHVDKASARLNGLSDAEKKRYAAILQRASSQLEQAYVVKAFAVGHDFDTLEDFANTIRGKGPAWLRDNLHLTASTRMTGVKQQWKHSCGPTTAQALFGELDPLFALDVHQHNRAISSADEQDGMRLNPDLAEEQREWLERAYPTGREGGIAVARAAQAGRGRWIEDVINDELKDLGLSYRATFVGGAYTLDRALADLDKALERGLPVPIVAKATDSSHYVLVIAVRTTNGQKSYLMHDPWTGQSIVRTEADFRNNTLRLSGNNTLIAVSVPTEQ